MSIPTILTVKMFSKKHPAFPMGGLRHNIFHADFNGMSKYGVLVRHGRRVLIDEEKFFEWLRVVK